MRHYRHVIAAGGAAEFVDVVHDGLHQGFGGLRLIDTQGVDEALFAEFFAAIGAGFGDAVGIEQQRVARVQGGRSFGTTPVFEGAQHGGGGVEYFEIAGGAQQQRRTVRAVHVADLARGIVVDGEDERGETFGGGGIEEVPVDGGQHFGGTQ